MQSPFLSSLRVGLWLLCAWPLLAQAGPADEFAAATRAQQAKLLQAWAAEPDAARLPLRMTAHSMCFRAEAGSHGRDTRGMIRQHQFDKIEMFVYCKPEDAEAEHERMLSLQEKMLQLCELPYRVIDVAAGDLGSSAARKYDVEAWVPTQQAYRELTSTSNCTSYQARRLDVRYRPDGGKTVPVATLNGTLATTRWIVALLETHQRADGSVVIPEVLRPYLGGLEVAEPIA